MTSNLITQAYEQAVSMVTELEELRGKLVGIKIEHAEEIQTYKDTLAEHFIHYELLKERMEKKTAECFKYQEKGMAVDIENEKLKVTMKDLKLRAPMPVEYYDNAIGNLQSELEEVKQRGWTDKKQGFISEFMDRSESWGEYKSFMREYHPDDASDEED